MTWQRISAVTSSARAQCENCWLPPKVMSTVCTFQYMCFITHIGAVVNNSIWLYWNSVLFTLQPFWWGDSGGPLSPRIHAYQCEMSGVPPEWISKCVECSNCLDFHRSGFKILCTNKMLVLSFSSLTLTFQASPYLSPVNYFEELRADIRWQIIYNG